MFVKTNRICGRISNWDSIKWHINKVSTAWYSAKANPAPINKPNKSLSSTYNVIPQPRHTVSEEEREEFVSLFPGIVKDLTDLCKDMPDVTERHVKVLQYNVPNHKQASGLAVVSAYKMLEYSENATPENIRLASILGWCVDLLLCSYQINDDIMDASDVRRGLPCWYRKEGVGNQAINDAILIENAPYLLLRKYFTGHHCYVPSFEWLHEVTMKTAFGQSLDTDNRINGKPNLDAFTMDRHRGLAKYKGTYPQYLLPVKLGMFLAGRYDAHLYGQVKNILIELGEFFTAQNDILDCYGDPTITGKLGSDIREGKCTWLAVTALKNATRAQRQLLKEHYGNPGPESDLQVRKLYDELGVLETFSRYEEESYDIILEHIQAMSQKLPEEMLLKIVNTTYGRQD